MFNLRKNERIVLVFLSAALLTGLVFSRYKKFHTQTEIRIAGFDYDKKPVRYSVNINTASIGELVCLKGIGKTLAGRIVEYRSANGSFVSIDDIKNVKGIGEALFGGIKDNITVE
jgi:comEA protein